MSVCLLEDTKDGFSLKIDFKYNKSMLEGEEEILKAINEAGSMATAKLLSKFDTDGSR